MQAKIIELKQAPVMLVEIPADIRNLKVNNARNKLEWFKTSINKGMSRGRVTYSEYIALPYGCWAIVGILSDLTEDLFVECVDRTKTHPKYWNYNLNYFREFHASDSFASLLESEKVYTENPYARPNPKDYNTKINEYWILEKKWQEAQSRTIDPERTVVLLKK